MSDGTYLNNGRYKLISQQGSGGMAVIYRAIDQQLGRHVAIKIMRPSLTSDPQFITRFKNEARSIANLAHPNIVTVHDVGSDNTPDGTMHYIVMEFVEGQDLKKVIKRQGALGVERALSLAIQICAGIGFAHRAGIVHADIKPQNILLNSDNVVKITDFGIAQAWSDTQQQQPPQREKVVWGSPQYFAPEQAQGEKPSTASDVYAIGIVMFEMLTGRLPFIGASQQELAMAHIKEPVPLVTQYNASVPESLARIVYKVMSKDPNDRYSKADQLGRVLISYRDRQQSPTLASPSAPVEQSLPPQSSGPAVTQPHLPSIGPSSPPPSGPSFAPGGGSRPQSPAPPTQPYNPAPSAPGYAAYGQPATPRPSFDVPPQSPAQPVRDGSGAYRVAPPSIPDDQRRWPTDPITLLLAFMAFMAVLCLLPLYFAVIQAYT